MIRKLQHLKKIGQSGDTIIEVVLAITVISVILGGSVVLVNRNTRTLQATQEHSAGTRIAQSQLEALRAYAGSNADELKGSTGPLHAATGFCMKLNTSEPVAISPTETACKVNSAGAPTTDDPAYNIVITVTKHTLDGVTSYDAKVRVTWDSLTNHQDQVTLTYRTYDKLTPTIGADLFCAPDEQGTWPNCEPRTCDPVTEIGTWPVCSPKPLPPTQFAVSHSSYAFPSWHLYNSTGTKPKVNITVRNATALGGGVSNVGAVSLTGTHATSFRKASDGCSNRVLQPQASCTISVEFTPPSGPAHNYYSNQNTRQATLTISGGAGSAARSVALSGKTYSDRLRPGDEIRGASVGPVPYKSDCYVNVESCSPSLYSTYIAGNGNLILAHSYCKWGGWGPPYPNYPGTGNRFAMQPDGNLVFYGYNGGVYYHSNTFGMSDLWLQVNHDGTVFMTQGSSGPAVRILHANGVCYI